MRAWSLCAVGALAVVAVAAGPVGARDRLERLQGLVRQVGEAAPEALAAELAALVDEEILENLRTGGVFASEAFIQERLDALTGAWGGARFGVRRLPRAGSASSAQVETTVGLYAMEGLAGGGSVRVFSSGGGSAGLLASLTHEGTPQLHEWPPAGDGAPQLALSWLGGGEGGGGRRFRVEVWRRDARALSRVWSIAEAVGAGLVASEVRIARGEVRLRYEARYPGWKPGCEGQTEHEDVYRAGPMAPGVHLARRRVVNGWHRELQEAVTRFFDALARQDRRVLAELVPESPLRARLPLGLVPEPACEVRPPESPEAVVVAATDERPPRRAPWSLWWRRHGRGWRLTGAAPVLQ